MVVVGGLGLLWPLPLGGALLMVTAAFGLAVLAGRELDEPVVNPAVIESADRR